MKEEVDIARLEQRMEPELTQNVPRGEIRRRTFETRSEKVFTLNPTATVRDHRPADGQRTCRSRVHTRA
jgi:hypothetical protein